VAVAGTAAALVSAADETFFEPWHPVVKHVAITLERLPAIFNDFTIAHLSDFHYHPFFTAKPISKAVRLVNQLEPDLIVLTGDFVTVPLLRSSERSSLHIKAQAEPCSALLAGLRAKLGIVTVLGNHDQDSQPDVVTECLEAQRIKVLRNDAWSVERSGARLWIVGTDDVLVKAANLPRALRVVPAAEPAVLLAHEPDFADVAANYPIDLQLSGHSHGGQIRLPVIGAPVLPELARKYPWGLRRLRKMALYTNAGIGTITLPIRWNCPPEVTLLTLKTTHKAY